MKTGQKFNRLISKTEMGRRMASDLRYRIIVFAAASFALNLLYAFYHGAVGVCNQSLWFLTMCAFYTVLGTMRFAAVLCGLKSSFSDSDKTEYFVMKLSGVLLILLSFILTGVIYISLSQNIAVKYDEIMMITIATYTFSKITMAAVNAVKQRKNPSGLLAVIRNIRYAEVAASVLTLQRSMLVSFGGMSEEKIHLMNMLTGAAVCLFVLILGISMIIRGRKKG